MTVPCFLVEYGGREYDPSGRLTGKKKKKQKRTSRPAQFTMEVSLRPRNARVQTRLSNIAPEVVAVFFAAFYTLFSITFPL